MTKPTHTHRTQGGRYTMVAHYNGGVSLKAQMIVVYRDLDREVDTATTAKDWETNWRSIAADDCPVCLGAGTDQIKGNKAQPCGGCYGLGKVRRDGETPTDLWELAEVALRIIRRQQQKIGGLNIIADHPDVQELMRGKLRKVFEESAARQEQVWRDGKGHGPGGRRHVGD